MNLERETLRGWRRTLFIVVLAIGTLALHASALNDWWTYDDPQLLLFAHRSTVVQTFFKPSVYQRLATHAFTPILPWSLQVDTLGKVAPRGAYIHQWILTSLAVVLFFLLLTRYVPPVPAGCCSAIFAASWMMTYAAHTLMVRHYLEGLCAALAALLLWSKSERSLEWLAALFYLIAMLEKEVWAPLPLLLLALLLVERVELKSIVRRLVPAATAAIVYLVWRQKMIGSPSYGIGVTAADLRQLPQHIVANLSLKPAALMIVTLFLLLLMAMVALLRQTRSTLIVGSLLLLFALLPVIAVAGNFEWRYDFAISAVLIFGLGLAAEASRLPRTMVTTLLAILALGFVAFSPAQARTYEETNAAVIAEGQYVWSQPPTSPALLASAPGWYLSGLEELRGSAGPRYFLSEAPLALGTIDPAASVRYDRTRHAFRGLNVSESRIAAQRSLRDDTLHFSVAIGKKGHDFFWRLRAAEPGSWQAITIPDFAQYPLPPEGTRGVPEAYEQQYLLIRFVRADGHWSVTPSLPIPRSDGETHWSR